MGGGSVLTQHQTRDTETDGQRNPRDGSSGQPCALLEISYFTDEFAVCNILQHYFETGDRIDDELPGLIPSDTVSMQKASPKCAHSKQKSVPQILM